MEESPQSHYYPLLSMPMNTRPSNADAHPGRIVMEGQRIRRPKKQIEADEARKKAAASAASRCAEEEHQRVLQQLKDSEDAVEREEEVVREHSARLDLRYESLRCQRVKWVYSPSCRSSRYETPTPVDTNMDCEIERDPW